MKNRELVEWLFKVLFGLGFALVVAGLTAMMADAAPVENDTPGIRQGVFQIQQDKLPNGEDGHYFIDLVEEVEEEEESGGFMDSIQNLNPIGNGIQDAAAASMISVKATVVDLAFKWNIYATGLMINVVQFGFSTELINAFIDSIETVVSEISGIQGGFITGGLFGSLLAFAIIAAGIVGVYKMVVKRQPLGTFQVLFQTTLALVMALMIIGSFGPFMKGLNNISTDISASMLAGGASVVVGETRTQDQLKDAVGDSLWKEFVIRPYLVLQYGYDDIDAIGEERINELLALPQGDERETFVLETEVQERGNVAMTPEQLDDRIIFTAVYSIINAIVSIPVILLALAMLIFQVWFLLMAFIAPFVLIQACFPGQFPVIKRYLIELLYPLVCKIIVTAVALMVFSLGFLIYSIPVPQALGMAQYFASAILQFILFSSLFFIRHRIMKVMGAGNRGPFEAIQGDLVGLRHSMDNAADKIGGVAKIAGAAAIGVATGGASTSISKVIGTAVVSSMNKEQNGEEAEPTTVSMKEDLPGNNENQAVPARETTTVRAEQPEQEAPLKQGKESQLAARVKTFDEKPEEVAATGTDSTTTTVEQKETNETKPTTFQYETDAKIADEGQEIEIEPVQTVETPETPVEQDMSQPFASLGDYRFEIEAEKEEDLDDGDIEPERGQDNG